MAVLKDETVEVRSDADIVRTRQIVREWARQHGFSLVNQTKIVTAASELARNTVHYGGGGTLRLEVLSNGTRVGLQLTFEDWWAWHSRPGAGHARRLHHWPWPGFRAWRGKTPDKRI